MTQPTSTPRFQVIKDPDGVPIKAWVNGVEFEEEARRQLIGISKLPFIYKHVAVMPDCHSGRGCTIGSVVATQGAIVPAFSGVDLGCGMEAFMLPLKASDLPESLAGIRSDIEAAVPHGGPGDIGSFGEGKETTLSPSMAGLYQQIVDMYPQVESKYVRRQFGTLGTGNHFIELCLDENQQVWVMLHSGSRGPGNRIGTFFIEKAREDMRKYFINLPDQDMAYLPEGSEYFNDYIIAVSWAQEYARMNRRAMLRAVTDVMYKHFPQLPAVLDLTSHVSCHHNFVEKEHHFGANVWVTRKGAVRARQGDMGIIPGSMGTKSYIVSGLGNPDSFQSCSHGAGRRMSRGAAKKAFSLEDHARAMTGIEARLDADVIDETPGAYKSIDAVMEAQSDLVRIEHTLKQVLVVKG